MTSCSRLGLLVPVVVMVACAQSDPGITTSVKTQLVADDLVKARNIDVDTRDRVVMLTGTVHSAEEEAKALQIARSTRGVSDVVDNITIRSTELGQAPTTRDFEKLPPVTPVTEALTDAGITARVKSTVLASPVVTGLRIDVDTRDRVVTLTGAVSSAAEKARVLEVARGVENVIRVEDRLTLRSH